MKSIALWVVFSGWATMAGAAVDPLVFNSTTDEARYKGLVMELRCPKCQNQAIGSSDAPIAQDMRGKVYELMQAGQSDQDIVAWLEARYGSYILYKPRFSGSTLWLWLLPPLLLAAGAVVIARILTRRRILTADERTEADRLLGLEDD